MHEDEAASIRGGRCGLERLLDDGFEGVQIAREFILSQALQSFAEHGQAAFDVHPVNQVRAGGVYRLGNGVQRHQEFCQRFRHSLSLSVVETDAACRPPLDQRVSRKWPPKLATRLADELRLGDRKRQARGDPWQDANLGFEAIRTKLAAGETEYVQAIDQKRRVIPPEAERLDADGGEVRELRFDELAGELRQGRVLRMPGR